MRETSMQRLVLWREKGRSALVFLAGMCALLAAHGGIVAAYVPLPGVPTPAMALGRANLLCLVFPRRAHGAAPRSVPRTPRGSRRPRTLTDAHDDLLRGRDSLKVLRAFLALYGVAKLGARLNSTWRVFTTLWCLAFTAPALVEWRRDRRECASVSRPKVLDRWRAARADARWARRGARR